MNRIIITFISILIMPLSASAHENKNEMTSIDLQGHRGARGVLPENTIPAFLHALKLGVTTLEMDIAINADGNAVLSHEPWMSAKTCSHADGTAVSEEEEKTLRIYAMSDAEVAGFDCGSRGHLGFPKQKPMASSKPLLTEVFDAVAKYESENTQTPVLFNIEIKSLPEGDKIFHPEVAEFADILIQTIRKHKLSARTSIQSFDSRALEAAHANDTSISTVWLIENRDSFADNLAKLSFTPSVYSPYYLLVNADLISAAHDLNIKVIPWTVNDADSVKSQIELGVDGIITDYPEMGLKVIAELNKELNKDLNK